MISGSCSSSRESTVAASTGMSVSEITSEPASREEHRGRHRAEEFALGSPRNRIGR